MFSNTIKYELKQLQRRGWISTLAAVMLIFIGFAAYNTHAKVTQRTNDIEGAKEELKKNDKKMLDNIKKIEAGEDTGLPYWKLPTDPSVVGFRHPRLATMDASPLAILATGQSDMYSHFMKTSSYGDNFALDIAEISNPIQLLFGTFDLAFVFMFIIPLLIIAFTYNVLSKERELGTLRIIGAQPISISKWLGQKMFLRFAVFALISAVVFLMYLLIFSPQAFGAPLSVLLALLQILAYELFWFALAAVVNLRVNDSSKNAMTLIGFWLLIVLIIPVTVNQLSSSLYPSPSRLSMLNEIRQKNREVEKKQEEILDSYLRDHPELANTSDDKDYGFWHKYYASQDILKEQISPLIQKHESALENRQRITSMMKYLSPAIIFQESFTKLAGSSTQDYEHYKKQVIKYTDTWRGHIVPLLFSDVKYSAELYRKRPLFEYKSLNYNRLVLINVLITLIMISVIYIIGRLGKSKQYL